MTTQNREAQSGKAKLKELLDRRMKLLENLAGQLEKWEQATTAVTAAQTKANTEAAVARGIWDDCLAGGWTAKEMTSVGLRPPAAPRVSRGTRVSATKASS